MRFALILLIAFSVFSVDLCAQQGKKSPEEMPNSEKMQRGKRQQQGRQRRNQQRFNPRLMFSRLDKNQDNVITADEVPQRMQQRMGNVDSDGNGEITMKEFATALKNQRDRLQGAMGRGDRANGESERKGGKKGGRKGMGKNGDVPTPEVMLNRMDRNADQVLTQDELPERMKKKFSELDKNGDNQLDQKELVSMVERLKAAKQSKGNRYDTDPEKSKGQTPKRPPRDG